MRASEKAVVWARAARDSAVQAVRKIREGTWEEAPV